MRSPFGVVELRGRRHASRGFREAPLLDNWVNSGVYVLGDEALARLPERGDHEQSTFPELAAEGKLRGYRHTGVWLTVNTPKDLRVAADFMDEHPDWRPQRQVRMSVDSPNFEGLDRWAFAAAAGREAVGLGADLGATPTATSGRSSSCARASRSASSSTTRRTRAGTSRAAGPSSSSARWGRAILNTEVIAEGACVPLPPGTVHRVTAIEDTTILEVSTPHLDDVVRLEDAYGRAGHERTLTFTRSC